MQYVFLPLHSLLVINLLCPLGSTGIQKFLPQGIVRVGGRSTSEVLKPFSLRELSKGFQHTRKFPPHLRRAVAQVRDSAVPRDLPGRPASGHGEPERRVKGMLTLCFLAEGVVVTVCGWCVPVRCTTSYAWRRRISSSRAPSWSAA